MARYTNIVSFDDAKAASRRRRIQESSEEQRLRAIGAGPIRYDLSLFAAPERQRDSYDYDEAEEQAPHEDQRDGGNARAEARERRRRERTKARADRMFSKQFESDAAGFEQAEDAPRAALYEGRMGSTQRRAARMQRASEAASGFAKLNPAGWFSSLNISTKSMKIATAVLCAVLTVVFLYAPAQQYYQSVREHDRLAAEYSSIAERNAVLTSQNQALASNAGKEDAVRQKYGYVVEGEETAVVTGLSDDATAPQGDGVEANVLSSSVKAPEEWYTPFLDAFFGVS